MNDMNVTLLTMKAAAARMGISTPTLYRAVNSGKVKAVRTPGGVRRIPESEVERYWSEQNLHLEGDDGETE